MGQPSFAVTDHRVQSADCTTSTRAVTERLHTSTEDSPVLDRPEPLKRFYVIPTPNINAPIYLLPYTL